MNEQGATPRTDAAIKNIDVAFIGHDGLSSSPEGWVEPDFARELERDNARLQTDCERMRKALEACIEGAEDVLGNWSDDGIVDEMSRAMNGLRQDAEAARAALRGQE